MYKYPVYQPNLTGNEKKYVDDCIDSTWISSKGKYLPLFEQNFAKYVGIKYAAAVCNGTVALHLALLSLGIGKGDEVIVPTLTYIASVNSIAYTGATPVFVDSLASNWQMDPDDVRRKITPKTKAIMAVHLYGNICDMVRLKQIAKEHNLFLIEDCAEAFGSKLNNKHAGTFGDIGTFSFFGNKTITTGEGGMVIINDEILYKKTLHLKGQGLATGREYWHDIIGYNYRMTNICAAIGTAQLEKADEFLARKRAIAECYKMHLANAPVSMQAEEPNTVNSYWMVSILVNSADKRDPLRKHLAENGIETRPVFYPVHTMPMYIKKPETHPVSEDIASRGINLPSYPDLTEGNIKEICAYIKKFYEI